MTSDFCQVHCSRNGTINSLPLRLVGLDVVEAHLSVCRSGSEAEALRAWVCELEHREYDDPRQLTARFRQVDLSEPPIVSFHLTGTALRIDTLIDFRTGVVLVTHVSEVQRRLQSANI